MLAFLSVLEPKTSTEPTKKKKKKENENSEAFVGEIDRHVLANIFSFAAPPVVRGVYFESP
ncbi:hypothetical protein PR001_g26432 [Phytophthora rubi]|uniref:Uncharacterized protein n=1 Tax=Phytophthora rubi TaxID=129364 RepID=A0A6A3HVB5_9STRA|nr:hypothetical protein PR001_g26432 [Phytophthora rubi]KAE8973631.1 hypothetical protein PR002_g26146 [Phytophthora rubi]